MLAKTDFDPATLWQWGTMQAMALIGVLKAAEAQFGEEGQKMVCDALRDIGLDVGRQILDGVELPPEITEAEFVSFYATVINRIAYASLEEPQIDGDGQVTFDIVWCPHQDHYGAFDCRVQRYFVQGMIDAAREHARFRAGRCASTRRSRRARRRATSRCGSRPTTASARAGRATPSSSKPRR